MGVALLFTLLIAARPAEPPAVLLEPRAALEYARALPQVQKTVEGSLLAAEIQLLAGDARAALETVDAVITSDERLEARRLRLELDARAALGDSAGALPLVEPLAAAPGWASHAYRRMSELERARWQRAASQIGVALFSLSLMMLLLAGARELLRPRRDAVVVGAVAVAAGLAVASVSPALSRILGVVFVACVALVHAAVAAERRIEPGPRGRLVFAVLLVLGSLGAAAAVISPLTPSLVLRALAR